MSLFSHLKKSPLISCLCLAIATTFLLSLNDVTGPDSMPVSDGYAYTKRIFLLYGYLHSGQWAMFWNTLTVPVGATLFPFHYLLFLLLPSFLAGMTSYGTVLGLSAYLFLAIGAYGMAKALEREEWAVPLYLACVFQNISVDHAEFYYTDISFYAVGTMALAAQLHAWKAGTFRASIFSGALAGYTFWIKPANAVVFILAYLCAEMVRAGIQIWKQPHGEDWKANGLARHVGGIAAGFFPLALTALYCGGLHVILSILYANEIAVDHTPHPGVAELFYFPLCLSYYYNLLVLGVISVIAIIVTYLSWKSRSLAAPETSLPFRGDLLLPIVIAALVIGEYSSMGMATRTMRSLLLILPPMWLLIFWLAELARIRARTLAWIFALYSLCALSQFFFDTFPSKFLVPEHYSIAGDWYKRFPTSSASNAGAANTTRLLLEQVSAALPQGGKIATGSERLYLNNYSLNWFAERDLLLRGETSPYDYERLVTRSGFLLRASLTGANAILLYSHDDIQYSEAVTRTSSSILQYYQKQPESLVRIIPVEGYPPGSDAREGIGYLILLPAPLSDAQVEALAAAVQAPVLSDAPKKDSPDFAKPLGLGECHDIVLQWWKDHSN